MQIKRSLIDSIPNRAKKLEKEDNFFFSRSIVKICLFILGLFVLFVLLFLFGLGTIAILNQLF